MTYGTYAKQIATLLGYRIQEGDLDMQIDTLNAPAGIVLQEASKKGVILFAERNPRIAKIVYERDSRPPFLPIEAAIKECS